MGSGRGIRQRVRSTARGDAPAADNEYTEHDIKDGAEAYTHFVRNTPVLTRVQEHELGLRASKGDETARQKLVEHNQLWVLREARKLQGLGVDFDDLVQEGNLGLMRAARDYSPERGTFITYARHWVHQFMRRAAEQKGSTQQYGSTIPSYLYSIVGKVKKEKQRLCDAGDELDVDQIADVVEETPARVRAALDVLERSFVSVDKTVGKTGESSTTVGEMIADKWTVEGEAESNELTALIAQGLENLGAEEREFMEKRYGLNGEKARKQKDVCQELGITRSRASSLQEQALAKLREHLQLTVPHG